MRPGIHFWLFPCSGSGFSMGLCRCCSLGACKYLAASTPVDAWSLAPRDTWKETSLPAGDCKAAYLSAWAFPGYWESWSVSNTSWAEIPAARGGKQADMSNTNTQFFSVPQPPVHGASSLCPVPTEMVPVPLLPPRVRDLESLPPPLAVPCPSQEKHEGTHPSA